MSRKLLLGSLLPLAFGLAVACDDTVPEGLRRTPDGNGAVVRWDPLHRPLPDLPLPNDVATFADPTSRTGLRVNVSLVAPTAMEQRAREAFNDLEGWGTSAPVNVAFDRAPGDDPRLPAIDLDDVAGRMAGDEHDLSNDPVYVVDLVTGLPVFLDVGSGMYPVSVRDPFKYFANDPKKDENNVVFETVEEGAGLAQDGYRPALDLDFDGVLDHPNTLGRPLAAGGVRGVDDILTWYERETDTLVLRPVVPLEEKREYAVVVTDRLRGQNGQPVRSPFPAIHHPSQRTAVARLREILADQRFASYYGDLAGTGLDKVAFTWTFTTMPTHEDMRLLRDGLYGKGPFARFATDAPAELEARQVVGLYPYGEEPPAGWQGQNPACAERSKRPYVMKLSADDVRESLRLFFTQVFSLSPGQLAAVDRSYEAIDHVVVGTFKSPFLLGDPKSTDPDSRFHLDMRTGKGDIRLDDVGFMLVVPKARGELKQPFPVSFWGHGVTGHSDEILLYAGDYARQGIALFAYNDPEHGLVLEDRDRQIGLGILTKNCLVPFLGAFENGRTRDVTGDGKGDSGWTWWTSHIAHTRDNVRQGVLDGMQALRALRSFDGRVGLQDYDANGTPDKAGDFDGDGTPDIGGPNVPYFAAGGSLGGIQSGIQGGIEPYIVAAAPMSGGGTLAMDVAMRSYGVVESVTSQMMGPFVVAVPAKDRPAASTDRQRAPSSCVDPQRSVRLVVNEGVENRELEIACLEPKELGERVTVVVTNLRSGETRCARTGADGTFGIPIPTSIDDPLDIQVYDAPDAVESYDGCKAVAGAPVGRRISTWERTPAPFRGRTFAVEDPLVAPNEGLGLRRQSPSLRRLRDLAQMGVDPADPINFAPHYMLRPLFDETGKRAAPHALLNVTTVGDNFVQVASGLAFGRAAGAIPFLPPSALERFPAFADYVTPAALYEELGRRTPMKLLVEAGTVEGIARFGRTKAGAACKANARPASETCKAPEPIDATECATALADPDWLSEGAQLFDQAHPAVPLRLARLAERRVSDGTTLAAAWEPRLRGTPGGPDETAWRAGDKVVANVGVYVSPKGSHTWNVGDVCRAWDHATYGNALMARFFATQGKDVYYLSHPRTHGCLATGTCDFLR